MTIRKSEFHSAGSSPREQPREPARPLRLRRQPLIARRQPPRPLLGHHTLRCACRRRLVSPSGRISTCSTIDGSSSSQNGHTYVTGLRFWAARIAHHFGASATARGNLTVPAPPRDTFAAHRVALRRPERGDPRERGVVGLAQQVVVLLPAGYAPTTRKSVSADARRWPVPAGRTSTSPARDVERRALRPAQLEHRAARDHGQDLVRGRVEVVEVEHAVHPRPAPAVARRTTRARRSRRRRGRAAPGTARWGSCPPAARSRSRAASSRRSCRWPGPRTPRPAGR